MTKAGIAAVALIAAGMSACQSIDDKEIAYCGTMPDAPRWDRCIEQHNIRYAARKQEEAAQQRENDALAGLLLLGFMGGYNQAMPRPVTCWNYGPMVQCQ